MSDTSALLVGTIQTWPSKDQMELILRNAGLTVECGKFSIRVKSCSHFVFQDYEGTQPSPTIDADAESTEEMLRDGLLVSDALKVAKVAHDFEVYSYDDELIAKFGWPNDG